MNINRIYYEKNIFIFIFIVNDLFCLYLWIIYANMLHDFLLHNFYNFKGNFSK